MSALPWIKLNNDLPDHPKSLHLCALLRQDRAWTHLVQLWLWASKHAPDGDLSGLPVHVIEHAAGWRGDPGDLVDSMDEAGFLEERRLVGWEKHQGAHIKKKERDKARAPVPRRKSADASRISDVPATQTGECVTNTSRKSEMESEMEMESESEKETKGGTCADAPVDLAPVAIVTAAEILSGSLDEIPKTRLRERERWMRVVWDASREGIREMHGPTAGPAKFRPEDKTAIRKMLDGGAKPSEVLKAALGVRLRLEGGDHRKPSHMTLPYAARAWEECRDLHEGADQTQRVEEQAPDDPAEYSAYLARMARAQSGGFSGRR